MTGDRLQHISDEELDRLARELPVAAPSPERVESSRDALLAMAMAEEPVRRRRGMGPRLVALAALVLLTLGVTWQLAHRDTPSDTTTSATTTSGIAAGWMQLQHARLHAGEGTSLAVREVAGDELVRLDHGSISVHVQKLKHDERFRIATADAEVEVHGTVFEVVARDDRLVSVRVLEGLVEVRPSGRPTVLLPAGHHWEAEAAGRPGAEKEAHPAGTGRTPAAVHRVDASGPQPVSPSVRPEGATSSSSHVVAAPSVLEPSSTERSVAALPASGKASHGPASPLSAPRSVASGDRSSPAESSFQRGWEALEQSPARAAYAFADAAEQAGGGALGEDARFWEAVALVRSHNPRARRALERFLELYPGSTRSGEVAAMLGWILLADGEGDAAKKQFERATHDPAPAVRENGREGLEAISSGRTGPAGP